MTVTVELSDRRILASNIPDR